MSLCYCKQCEKDVPGNMKGKPYKHKCICSDCPPVGYPTDETRCRSCPRLSLDLDGGDTETLDSFMGRS